MHLEMPQTLDIQRGKKLVARVLPAGTADGFPINRLDDMLAKGPQISASERQAMAEDVAAVRANTLERKAQRGAFVEHLLSFIPVLEFSLAMGRTHARMLAALPKNLTAGAHDALIAATAVHYGHAVLTRNVAGFTIFPGLKLDVFSELH